MSDPHAKAQTPPKTTDRHDESLVPPVQSGDGGATGTGATVRGVPVPGVPVCASHQRETRKQKIARQQNAAAGRAADRVCDPIRAAIDAGELTIRPAASPEAADPRLKPPPHIVDLAVEVSGWSPCRSKRGVVIFCCGEVVSHGYNYKPRGFACDGSEACKATCRREAVHAEQQALLAAGSRAHASEMLHVKTVDGKLVPSGGPSCVECSKLARAAGIAWVWLYHADGWRRYTSEEFHRLSLRSALREAQPGDQ